MKEHYDFSHGKRGLFYRGKNSYQVVINMDSRSAAGKIEVYKDREGSYRYRIKAGDGNVLYTDENRYHGKAECLSAVEQTRELFLTAELKV